MTNLLLDVLYGPFNLFAPQILIPVLIILGTLVVAAVAAIVLIKVIGANKAKKRAAYYTRSRAACEENADNGHSAKGVEE